MEIIPTVLRQVNDPGYYVRRTLPMPTPRDAATVAAKTVSSVDAADAQGWVTIGPARALGRADVIRFDHADRTYAVYRTHDDTFHATDGICPHGNTHLSTGLVKGCLIECPKHNGRFDIRHGSPQRPPVCVPLATYPVQNVDGLLSIKVREPYGRGDRRHQAALRCRVVSHANVATFFRELTLETGRRVSFWYGARSRQELFYADYFQNLASRFPTFRFEMALSEPLPGERWTGHVGFIHDMLEREYLAGHSQPGAVEYYLCGPPAMIEAARRMLAGRGIDPEQVAFDEFRAWSHRGMRTRIQCHGWQLVNSGNAARQRPRIARQHWA